MERDDVGKEIQRFEYNGCLIIHRQFKSFLPYGPPHYSKWEVHKINPDQSLTYVGHESDEGMAQTVVDRVINDNKWGFKLRPPTSRPRLG